MTPLQLEVLIHCYVSPAQHPQHDAPAVKEAHKLLKEWGLIEWGAHSDKAYWCVTNMGKAHLYQILTLPLPEQVFIGYDNRPINYD